MVDFIRKATKKSLLAMLKRVDQMTGRDWARLFEGVLFKDEFESFASGGGLDHGAMGGLADDDHTRYLDKDGTRALTGNWDVGAFDIRAADLTADSGGVYTDTITELTGDAGVTIDSVLLKDNQVLAIKLSATSSVATNVIAEQTENSGVTVDGVLVKDGGATLSAQFAAPVITQTSATLTLGATHYTVLCDGTSNTVTITLPAASGCSGRIYNIKAINIDNAVELAADGTEEIDGSTTNISFALMETVTVQSDNANWWII